MGINSLTNHLEPLWTKCTKDVDDKSLTEHEIKTPQCRLTSFVRQLLT